MAHFTYFLCRNYIHKERGVPSSYDVIILKRGCLLDSQRVLDMLVSASSGMSPSEWCILNLKAVDSIFWRFGSFKMNVLCLLKAVPPNSSFEKQSLPRKKYYEGRTIAEAEEKVNRRKGFQLQTSRLTFPVFLRIPNSQRGDLRKLDPCFRRKILRHTGSTKAEN